MIDPQIKDIFAYMMKYRKARMKEHNGLLSLGVVLTFGPLWGVLGTLYTRSQALDRFHPKVLRCGISNLWRSGILT